MTQVTKGKWMIEIDTMSVMENKDEMENGGVVVIAVEDGEAETGGPA